MREAATLMQLWQAAGSVRPSAVMEVLDMEAALMSQERQHLMP